MLISVMIVLWSCRDHVDPGHAAVVGFRCQSAAMKGCRRARKARNAAWPRRADQEDFCREFPKSALQTHLQGVDWAALAVVPEKRHRAALLSRFSDMKIARLAEEGKPRGLP
jgi:hypothetical protein